MSLNERLFLYALFVGTAVTRTDVDAAAVVTKIVVVIAEGAGVAIARGAHVLVTVPATVATVIVVDAGEVSRVVL